MGQRLRPRTGGVKDEIQAPSDELSREENAGGGGSACI